MLQLTIQRNKLRKNMPLETDLLQEQKALIELLGRFPKKVPKYAEPWFRSIGTQLSKLNTAIQEQQKLIQDLDLSASHGLQVTKLQAFVRKADQQIDGLKAQIEVLSEDVESHRLTESRLSNDLEEARKTILQLREQLATQAVTPKRPSTEEVIKTEPVIIPSLEDRQAMSKIIVKIIENTKRHMPDNDFRRNLITELVKLDDSHSLSTSDMSALQNIVDQYKPVEHKNHNKVFAYVVAPLKAL